MCRLLLFDSMRAAIARPPGLLGSRSLEQKTVEPDFVGYVARVSRAAMAQRRSNRETPPGLRQAQPRRPATPIAVSRSL
jgi:hypothetical protein